MLISMDLLQVTNCWRDSLRIHKWVLVLQHRSEYSKEISAVAVFNFTVRFYFSWGWRLRRFQFHRESLHVSSWASSSRCTTNCRLPEHYLFVSNFFGSIVQILYSRPAKHFATRRLFSWQSAEAKTYFCVSKCEKGFRLQSKIFRFWKIRILCRAAKNKAKA